MAFFTDIHAHVVYGVDDGPKTAQDMRDLLDDAHAQGITRIFATSHMEPGVHPFPEEDYAARLAEGSRYCAEQKYDLKLIPGAELLYTPAMDAFIRDRRLKPLGDSMSVLVEFMPDISADETQWALEQLEDQGYQTVLAHIERYECMKGTLPARLKKNFSVQYQINCRSVIESDQLLRGRRVRKLLDAGLVDYVATDMHRRAGRPPRMAEAFETLVRRYGTESAERLTDGSALAL